MPKPYDDAMKKLVGGESAAISRMARQQVDAIQDPDVLRRLTVKISVVKTMKEAEEYLLNPSRLENIH